MDLVININLLLKKHQIII